MDKILDNVWISDFHTARDWMQSNEGKFDIAVMSIGDFADPHWEKYGVVHKHFGGLSDTDGHKFDGYVTDIAKFIDGNSNKDRVIVHCWAGRNRSASSICAWLILKKGKSFNEALSTVESKHPETNVHPALGKVLEGLKS